MYKGIIVDDEPKAIKLLQDMLHEYCPELTIIGTAADTDVAYDLIHTQKPDILFLDIAMPRESGFDLLERLPNLDFEIIFVTGFDEYALQAIKFCALGYVVKPIQVAELVKAVNNAKRVVSLKDNHLANRQLLKMLKEPGNKKNRIGIPIASGIEFMATDQIVHCEGIKGCTKIFLQNGTNIISSYNLGEFIKLLKDYDFYAPHKSHLVNMDHIQRYHREGIIEMSNNSKVPVSRRRRQEFLELMKGRGVL